MQRWSLVDRWQSEVAQVAFDIGPENVWMRSVMGNDNGWSFKKVGQVYGTAIMASSNV